MRDYRHTREMNARDTTGWRVPLQRQNRILAPVYYDEPAEEGLTPSVKQRRSRNSATCVSSYFLYLYIRKEDDNGFDMFYET